MTEKYIVKSTPNMAGMKNPETGTHITEYISAPLRYIYGAQSTKGRYVTSQDLTEAAVLQDYEQAKVLCEHQNAELDGTEQIRFVVMKLKKAAGFGQYFEESADDVVENPVHYNQGQIDVIEALYLTMPFERFCGFMEGNIFKYSTRYWNKAGLEDLGKAAQYTKRLQEYVQRHEKEFPTKAGE